MPFELQIPLDNVLETKSLLEKKGIQLPVIPLEIGEMYCNKYSLSQLVGEE